MHHCMKDLYARWKGIEDQPPDLSFENPQPVKLALSPCVLSPAIKDRPVNAMFAAVVSAMITNPCIARQRLCFLKCRKWR
jgi:hypothetical protein